MLRQRAAIEEQRLETLATEQRIEDIYSEIKDIRGPSTFIFCYFGISI